MQFFSFNTVKNQRGAVALIVGICLFLFMGFAALAIDIGNLFVARNELQNAADAGALAGARNLYLADGAAVNENANQIAYDAATANESQKNAVDVHWEAGTNAGDIRRGHYSFLANNGDGGFVANDSTEAADLDRTDRELDTYDPDNPFINAVHVVTRRDAATPVLSFFARIFGFDSFQASAEAIAYIGFAGKLRPQDVDQPIAICQQALLVEADGDSHYSCTIGRMINSGNDGGTSNTGGWTSYDQNNPCSGGTNAAEMKNLVCEYGNPESIELGLDVATIGGQLQSTFKDFYDCWVANSENKTQPWEMTLLVIDCPGNNITTCQETVGAVTLTVIWVNDQNDPHYNNAPVEMGDWESSEDVPGEDRWDSFVEHFNLKNLSESGDELVDAPYAQKSIYFLPSCERHGPRGATGGKNFGILAAIPVLVR